MSICAYAIMRNEEEHVDRWCQTTSLLDERVVLDTGSTDETVARLRSHGVIVHQADILPFRFDVARNTALALVPARYDWVVRLDGDETFGDDWYDIAEKALAADDIDTVHRFRFRVINHGNGWGQITRDDFHRRSGFHWKYPTHEVLVGPMDQTVRELLDLEIHHYPVEKDRSFNAEILHDASLLDPMDHRMAFYFARELYYVGGWEACRQEMMRFLGLPGGWGPERAEAYRIIAAIDDFPEGWLWKAVAEAPERREPFVDLARLYVERKDYGQARAAIDLALMRTDRDVYTTDPSAWDDGFTELYQQIILAAP